MTTTDSTTVVDKHLAVREGKPGSHTLEAWEQGEETTKMLALHPHGQFEGVKRLFDTDTFSDVTIKVGDVSWPAHKAIICTQSKVLSAMCTSGFKESFSNVLNLDDDEPYLVHRMLQFLYLGNYARYDGKVIESYPIEDFPFTNPRTLWEAKSASSVSLPSMGTKDSHSSENSTTRPVFPQDTMTLHVDMHAIANKYDIPGLREVSTLKYAFYLKIGPSTSPFLFSLTKIYASTSNKDSELRKLAVQHAAENRSAIMDRHFNEQWFAQAKETIPEFADELLDYLMTMDISTSSIQQSG